MPWTVRRQLIGLAVLVGLVAAAIVSSPDAIITRVDRTVSDPLLFALAVAVLYGCRPFIAMPTMVAAGIVGFGFGIWYGIPIALAGTTLSSIPPYLVGRYFRTGGGILGRWCAASDEYFELAGDTRGMVASRIAPLPSDAISYTAGLSRVPIRPFVLGTAVGEIHWTVIAVLAGASARQVTTDGLAGMSPVVLVVAALVSLAVIAHPVYRSMGPARDRVSR